MMTVTGWIIFAIIAFAVAIIGLMIHAETKISGKWVAVGCSVIILVVFGGFYWWFNNTAAGARAVKTQQSNFNMGILRHVRAYDIEGDLIQEYKGKFDIEYDDDRILFDDADGLRHIIYYTNGCVIIDELPETE